MSHPYLDIPSPFARIPDVFKNVTASYKYYWFLSLLDLYVKEGREEFPLERILVKMVAKAWQPLRYFYLTFGPSDSFSKVISGVLAHYNIADDATPAMIERKLYGENGVREGVWQHLKVLQQNVPFRFLSPWLKTVDNALTARLSQNFTNGCPYALLSDGKGWMVQVNPQWYHYLQQNYQVLTDFTQLQLINFIQRYNPMVPMLSQKLEIKPKEKLATNRIQFWQNYLESEGPMLCPFTHRPLDASHFSIANYLPWSFFPSDVCWNMLPVDASVEQIKGNCLLNSDGYFSIFCKKQQDALRLNWEMEKGFEGKDSIVLQQYTMLGQEVEVLVHLSSRDFEQLMARSFTPMEQMARNMGYQTWNPNPALRCS